MKGINQEKLYASYPDKPFADDLVKDFIEQLPQATANIIALHKQKNYKQLALEAHALLGASCFVYAEQLSTILKEIEAKIIHQQTKTLTSLILSFTNETSSILTTNTSPI